MAGHDRPGGAAQQLRRRGALANPERTGWLTKQGEYIKTWRRRWFVLKQGKLFRFKDSTVTRVSKPRGVNRQYAF